MIRTVSRKSKSKVKKQADKNEDALEKMKSISVAGFGLLTWVNAIVKYYEVAKNVQSLAKESEGDGKNRELSEIKTALAALDAQLKKLNTSLPHLNLMTTEEAAIMSKRLAAASKLIEVNW